MAIVDTSDCLSRLLGVSEKCSTYARKGPRIGIGSPAILGDLSRR